MPAAFERPSPAVLSTLNLAPPGNAHLMNSLDKSNSIRVPSSIRSRCKVSLRYRPSTVDVNVLT
ncbi:hypothetical protein L210DRAFT_186371 [Boletus edulis BED1]|uniref:Uncharacterized protein n=1 Tax=Boletus edulis BED1 TaxID=1328754 RepID=A0AAD4BZ81_BOLED|nr:hypothetical protein L210DRAFT_186371 [Boletus edulis BED1]